MVQTVTRWRGCERGRGEGVSPNGTCVSRRRAPGRGRQRRAPGCAGRPQPQLGPWGGLGKGGKPVTETETAGGRAWNMKSSRTGLPGIGSSQHNVSLSSFLFLFRCRVLLPSVRCCCLFSPTFCGSQKSVVGLPFSLGLSTPVKGAWLGASQEPARLVSSTSASAS